MTLDEMLDGGASGATTVAAGWGQGRATYGGLVAGLLIARAEALAADPARRLRSASIAFVSPVAAGPVSVEGRVLRAGSSATQVEASLLQDDEPRAVLLASFGDARPSDIAVDTGARNPRPELPAPETVDAVPHVPGITPDFFEHMELRFITGNLPLTGASEPDFGGWMRFREPPASFGIRELVTLADAWPPAVLPMFDRPVAMSTLAWTFEPVGWPEEGEHDAPDAHWQYDVRTLVADAGYAHTSARIWDDRGRLRALSRETVAFFG
jgi:acyl-CoA thioesterase